MTTITTAPASPRRFEYKVPPAISEIRAILSAAAASPIALDVQDVVTLIVFTCVRPGELRDLRWEEIDLTNRSMLVSSKGDSRQVPFGNTVLRVLQARRKRPGHSEFVLGSSPHRVLHRVSRQLHVLSEGICKNTVNLRLLRVTFMERWVNSCGDLQALSYIAGYRSDYSSMKTLLTRYQLYAIAAEHQRRLEEQEQWPVD
jgi:integrase